MEKSKRDTNQDYEVLFHRYSHNPILTRSHWPYPANTVFNAGAARLKDGTTVLLCRVEDRSGRSHLTVARSANGVDNWDIDSEPSFVPDLKNHPEELWGLEDPRISYVSELDEYIISYTSYSRSGPGVSLAITKDFKSFKRCGMIMPPEDKDAALFPRRINGKWAMIHRPLTALGAHMWISYSPDLRHWGNHKLMLEARRGAWWDANKIGLSPPPLETKEGWLVIYHGVRRTVSGCLYRLGLALFDIDNPEHCIRRSTYWIFAPQESYERNGDVDNVVFPCGFTIGEDGDTIYLYYGCADSSLGLATGSIQELLDWLRDNANEEY